MRAIAFHDGWTCRHLHGEENAVSVSIPHDAMLAERRTEDAPGGINTGWYEGYDYLYEKRFTPDAAWAGKTMLLEFEGVYHNAEVYVNGEKAAYRPYGYTNFYVDVTERFVPGEENRIEVIARNADQPNSRWYSGAGIYRPVNLYVADKNHIQVNGVRIRTLSTDPATVEVYVETSGCGEAHVRILDGGIEAAAQRARTRDGRAAVKLTVPKAKLWSTQTPYLYTCRVEYENDTYETTFGIRTLKWGKDGLLINGERVIIQGACIHHDNGILGACCYPDAEERKIRLMKENGYNAIRSAHNPCSKALLDACDRLGVLVMDEYIDHWYIHKTEYDYVKYFDEWWKQDLADMVDKDYNHPSVILYSTGNEVSETAQERGIRLTGEMTRYLHSLDDTRPVTCGVNIFFNFLSSIGFGVYSDKKAKKEAEEAEKRRAAGEKAKEKKAVGSKFFNDLAGLLGADFMKCGATLYPCDVLTRDAFANMDIAGYNYGILRYKHDLKKYPERLILGSETFCSDAYTFRELAKKESRIIGDFVWAGMDYLGETSVGSWEYPAYAPRFSGKGWVSAGSGRVDLTGKPLCEALYTRVALEQAKGPYMGVRPVCFSGEKHSPSAWKMSDAMASWTWPGCEGRKAEVEVYARCAEAELRVNGKTVGRKKPKNDCIVRFDCTYEAGNIEAVTYDKEGRETGRVRLVTAGESTQLRAEPERMQVAPGRLSYIRLRYTDEKGEGKPMMRGRLKVEVKGGRLLGLGHACPYNDDSYLDNTCGTYYGEALAVVMAGESGEIELSVSDGTYSARTAVTICG